MTEKNLQTGKNMAGCENIVDRLVAPGLNFLVLTEKQRKLCYGLSLPLFIAELKDFWKNEVAGNIVWFSLEENKEKSKQMFDEYTTVLHHIFEIYVYKYGLFGDKIKDTMGIFLEDNPHISLVVIDSVEKIVDGEIEQMEYDHAYEILNDLQQAAIQWKVPLLVTMYEEDFWNGSKWNEVSDAVLRIEEGETKNSQEYTLCLAKRNRFELKLEIVFDSKSGKWSQKTTK